MRSCWLVLILAACGGKHTGDDNPGDSAVTPDACEGLACLVVDCAAKGQPPTSVSGTVYAPNGTLPLYGVNVYIPISDPGPLPAGVTCDRCSASFPGGAYAQAVTDETGHFRLDGVPATQDLPLVITVGKWRRQLTIPNVAACQDTPLATADTTLPKDRTQGDLPQIAITTGDADALECLARKLGIADTEFTTQGGSGAVHLYNGNGANKFATGFAGGTGSFTNATALWNDVASLSTYDIVLFSCEGGQFPATKSQAAMQAVHDYAGLGGRVFMSHWHNIWIGGEQNTPSHGLADWESIATFDFAAAQNETTQLTLVDENQPKGKPYATWLSNVGATPTRDELQVNEPRYTCKSVNPSRGERWVYVDPARSTPLGKTSVQDLLFTTPNDLPADQRCGKVVFSDMHVSSGSRSKAANPFPNDCATTDLTPQEKALAFIFFDIASCVGVLQ